MLASVLGQALALTLHQSFWSRRKMAHGAYALTTELSTQSQLKISIPYLLLMNWLMKFMAQRSLLSWIYTLVIIRSGWPRRTSLKLLFELIQDTMSSLWCLLASQMRHPHFRLSWMMYFAAIWGDLCWCSLTISSSTVLHWRYICSICKWYLEPLEVILWWLKIVNEALAHLKWSTWGMSLAKMELVWIPQRLSVFSSGQFQRPWRS